MNLNPAIKSVRIDCSHSSEVAISGIQFHSGKVKKGELFVAISGMSIDGHDFIQQAIGAGAVAVVGEKDISGLSVPYFRVSNSRKALAQLACQYYEQPSKRHTMIGITGTNGKTTTAYLLRHIIESAGKTCSLIGTVSNRINGRDIPSVQTTPDALQLQKWLSESEDQVVIMEVSSHGIEQDRVFETEYDFVVFTNLSHDHLDYHGSLENYYLTKERLFNQLKTNGEAITTSIGRWGKRLIDHLITQNKVVYSFGDSKEDMLEITPIQSESSLYFQVREGIRLFDVKMPLPGAYNAWNVAVAWLTAHRMGIESAVIQQALGHFPGVSGRFEVFPHPTGAQFIVDYAHTPDGFEQFLRTLHERRQNRLIHIFGFRGNGDPSKRSMMLDISSRWSDEIILTMDNLNGSDRESMLMELQLLINQFGKKKCTIIDDRTKAIEYAWQKAGKGDQIAITGKGREAYDQPFALPSMTDPDTLHYLLQK
ncbi:UDP-N-acetylmuramoyl-L-alanyl-D-glutamate--2,6-diaminopimelate ligase [Paenibacillus alkaliterrae]|uniref:UDP-N-acetylmuramoyl-L-alanyl-D-glutamate--2, 6-diaminopimelate ligase n=1 Tax=Paenibacillus alkaliterrae TaxID=320909 RepID=UPI001F19CD7B|nr:UDP-N-acetylmuramoyl-L-alanyl-D-glutamate--2,6-diaminopimelate ligase [Paenibacillus alkaliterrae]MCF2941460.1 UDP-N-acetylmuramoyl-L-alanyl-D-glutamate--2,6-diaminopimelate ligase [Paenibacillus alkaliterrae]